MKTKCMSYTHSANKKHSFSLTDLELPITGHWILTGVTEGERERGVGGVRRVGSRWTPDRSPNVAGCSLGQTLVLLHLKYFIWIFTWSCCLKCLDLSLAAPVSAPQTKIKTIQAHKFLNNQQFVYLCLRSYRAWPTFCSICNSYISSPSSSWVRCVCVCVYIKVWDYWWAHCTPGPWWPPSSSELSL